MFNNDEGRQTKMAFSELRQDVADLKHFMKSTQVSVQLLEEKFQEQDTSLSSLKNQKNPKLEQLLALISTLERKMSIYEKFQEKVSADLRNLNSYAQMNAQKIQDFEKEVSFQKNRLDEVAKLKSTLSSISQAMQQKPKIAGASKYKVKPGDSLEKIARQHNVGVADLRRANQLTGDRIVVGQDLDIPHD